AEQRHLAPEARNPSRPPRSGQLDRMPLDPNRTREHIAQQQKRHSDCVCGPERDEIGLHGQLPRQEYAGLAQKCKTRALTPACKTTKKKRANTNAAPALPPRRGASAWMRGWPRLGPICRAHACRG